jgi:hypothetical protein
MILQRKLALELSNHDFEPVEEICEGIDFGHDEEPPPPPPLSLNLLVDYASMRN